MFHGMCAHRRSELLASSSAVSALGCHLSALLTATAVLRHSDLLKPLTTSSNLRIFHATELFLQLPIAYKSQCSVDFDGRISSLLHVTTFPKSVYFRRAFQSCHVTFVLYSYDSFLFPRLHKHSGIEGCRIEYMASQAQL